MKQACDDEIRKAIALVYDGSGAPRISAKGEGDIAEEIIQLADEHDIPLCDNAALVEILSQIEVGENVPQDLYTAVAHIIAFAYRLRNIEPLSGTTINPI